MGRHGKGYGKSWLAKRKCVYLQTGRNICHGSDSVDSANREIAHWFKENEINDYASPFINSWVYE